MTKARRSIYKRGWFEREIKIDMRLRRKEYNRKVRHAKTTDESEANDVKHMNNLLWNTMG